MTAALADSLPAVEQMNGPALKLARLRINEIFHSLQGEARNVGIPTVFVRLTGCPLRCQYCDTEYAFHEGISLPLDEIILQVQAYGTRYVCVTGGEPLVQRGTIELLRTLCDAGYKVSLETSGAMDVADVDPRVSRVIDLKTPGSGEQQRNLLSNLAVLTSNDSIKFVICDRADYEWSKTILFEHQLDTRCEVLFSPSYGQQPAQDLAEWIMADRLPVRFQIQLHKFLWGERRGV